MGDEHESLGPGQRLPDSIEVCLADGKTCRLHELIHRTGHTAVFIGGAPAHESELARHASSIQSRMDSSFMEGMIVISGRSDGQHPRLGPTGAQQLGITDLTLLVIRPDGHVGLRADRDHPQSFAAYHALLASGQR
jgi:hypothetical protein